jgi:crotonobetainyl-CoA:carnitine CoA-transferase CaiB-like acyl-CoA transferase
MNEARPGPLGGVRIVDFTENMAGPFGTMILADQGADVIKVESPTGDALRHRGTGAREMATYFANLNRSKRSLSVDLRDPRSAEVRRRLLDGADVVVHSFRPAAAKRLGLDAATVRTERIALIHASIIGYGTTGPWAGRPVYDHVIQAASGMADQQRRNDQDPARLIRHGLVDKTAGHVLAQSVSAALFARTWTQVGVALDIVMLNVAISLLWPDGMMNHTALDPEIRGPAAALNFELTPTLDGWVSLIVHKDKSWKNLAAALELNSKIGPGAAPGEIMHAARAILNTMTSAAACELLASYDVPCAPVVAMGDVHAHPQVVANRTLVDYDHQAIGAIRQPRPTPVFPGVVAEELRGAPLLGADSIEVLNDLGFDQASVRSLIDDGVVRTQTPVQ